MLVPRAFGVRAQIVALCALPLAFLIAILGISLAMQRIPQQSFAISQHYAAIQLAANQVYGLLDEINVAADDYMHTGKPADLRRYAALRSEASVRYARLLRATGNDAEERAASLRFIGDMRAVFPYVDHFMALLRAGKKQEAQQYGSRTDIQKLGSELVAAKAAIYARQITGYNKQIATLRAEQALLDRLMLAVAATGILLSLAFAAIFGLRTVRRLRHLSENAAHLARREPTTPIGGNDEISDVDEATREMARKLDESLSLQIALTPPSVPDVHGLHFDSVYVPAANESRVGGDWYDVFEIGENLVGISIGDVAGHGLNAASTMVSLREAIRVAARIEGVPSRTLARVNQTLCVDHPGALATTLFGIFDGNDGAFSWSTAGHPAPIVVRPESGLELLEGKGFVLGIDPNVAFEDHHTTLGIGCALVLYTDGMVEVERDYLAGLKVLQRTVLEVYGELHVEHPAAAVSARVFAEKIPDDDAALLFIGVTHVGGPLFTHKRAWSMDARDALEARRIKRAILWQLAGLAAIASHVVVYERVVLVA